MIKYVPILRWKRGEQTALKMLDEKIKDQILPYFDIQYTKSNTTSLAKSINDAWEKRLFLYCPRQEWSDEEGNGDMLSDGYNQNGYGAYNSIINQSKEIEAYGIPVFSISFLLTNDKPAEKLTPNGLAIQIQNNDFEDLSESLLKLLKDKKINKLNTDLIFDLRYVRGDDIYSKKSLIKSAIFDLEENLDFRRIIVSSASFPDKITSAQYNTIYSYPRIELDIHETCEKLQQRSAFDYVYSDYGPTTIDDFEFVVGMSPIFKIKYTSNNEYIYIKGYPLKKGGLDIDNVSCACKVLVESDHFSGGNYSWGDEQIHKRSNCEESPGNLTSWVGFSFNHHMTLVVKQI